MKELIFKGKRKQCSASVFVSERLQAGQTPVCYQILRPKHLLLKEFHVEVNDKNKIQMGAYARIGFDYKVLSTKYYFVHFTLVLCTSVSIFCVCCLKLQTYNLCHASLTPSINLYMDSLFSSVTISQSVRF